MKKNLLLATVLALLLVPPIFMFTQANDIYISPHGSDAKTCNWLSPCKTFKRAANLAQPGDTIHILEGRYNEVFTISKSGSAKAYISIIGYNAIAKGMVISGNYITVSQLEVIDSISHGIIANGKHIVIQRSSVHHSITENGVGPFCNTDENAGGWGSGIKIERGGENITVYNNMVYENCGEGIAVTMGKNVIIDNNTSRDNFSVNIYVDNSSFTTVSNNKVICTGNGYLRDERRASGIAIAEESYSGWGAQRHDNSILNNTIDGCNEGIGSWKPEVPDGIEKNLTIKDNTVLHGTYLSISLDWTNQNVLVEGNIVDIPIRVKKAEGVILLNNTVVEPTK